MGAKKVAVIIRGYSKDQINDPYPLWEEIIKKLKATKRNVQVLHPFERADKNIDEVYIIGTYFSAPLMCLLQDKKTPKRVYVFKGKVSLTNYLKVLKKYRLKAFSLYYLLSALPLGFMYHFIVNNWSVKNFLLPTKTSKDKFIKDNGIDKTVCNILPSPVLAKTGDADNEYPLWKKEKKEKWIAYAGRANLLRGVDILIEAFSMYVEKENNAKLLLLLLPDKHRRVIEKKLRNLPKNSYHLTIKKIKPKEYASIIKNSDIFVGPYTFSYSCPDRPVTLLEAMNFEVPVIVSDVLKDNFFKDNFNCLKHKNLNAHDLYKKLALLSKNKKLRKSLADKAKVDMNKLATKDNLETIIQNE